MVVASWGRGGVGRKASPSSVLVDANFSDQCLMLNISVTLSKTYILLCVNNSAEFCEYHLMHSSTRFSLVADPILERNALISLSTNAFSDQRFETYT